jgi:hypothetical protein
MSKLTAFIILLVLRIMYQPSTVQKEIAPFTAPSQLPASTSYILPANQISTSRITNTDNVTPFNKEKDAGAPTSKTIKISKK